MLYLAKTFLQLFRDLITDHTATHNCPWITHKQAPVRILARPFYRLWPHQFSQSRTTLSANLCKVKRSFKQYQNEHGSVKVAREKGKKNRKFSWKSSSTTHLPTLLSNPKILKALPKTFPYKMKPTKCPGTEKKWWEKRKRRGEERKWKEKVMSFLCMPELHKRIFCIWIRRSQSVWPVNGFVVSFIS